MHVLGKPIDTNAINRRLFLSKIRRTDKCWVWTGYLDRSGYGHFSKYMAHRVSYALFKRPIPAGLVIDHKCHNRRCVNPMHLRAITQRRNSEWRQKDYSLECGNGHRLFGQNLGLKRSGARYCKMCRFLQGKKSRWLEKWRRYHDLNRVFSEEDPALLLLFERPRGWQAELQSMERQLRRELAQVPYSGT